MMFRRTALVSLLPIAALLAACGSPTRAPFATSESSLTAPGLGSSASFAVLAGETVTNTGPSIINGDIGVSPGTAITGFPPGIQTGGATHSADAVALKAKSDLGSAFNELSASPCTRDLTGSDLGGLTLGEGVYCFSSSAQLTGTLTLDAKGKADAVFIFKMGSTLVTASNASVSMINGGTGCQVFWKVGSSATIGTNTKFVGSLLALTSVALQTGATVDGRAMARNGAVTMDDNRIAIPICTPPDGSVPVLPVDSGTSVPSDAGTTPADTAPAVAADAGPPPPPPPPCDEEEGNCY